MASVFLFSPDTNNTVGKLIIVQIKSNFLNLTRDKQHAIIDNKSETLEPKVEASGPNLACQSFFFLALQLILMKYLLCLIKVSQK